MVLDQGAQPHGASSQSPPRPPQMFLLYVPAPEQILLPAATESKKIICFTSVGFQVLLRDIPKHLPV